MKQGVKIHQQLMQTFNLRSQIEGIIILNASYLTEGLFTTKCLCTIFTCSYILKYRSWDTPIRIFFKHSAWNMNAWKNLTHFFNFNGFGVTLVKSKKFHASTCNCSQNVASHMHVLNKRWMRCWLFNNDMPPSWEQILV